MTYNVSSGTINQSINERCVGVCVRCCWAGVAVSRWTVGTAMTVCPSSITDTHSPLRYRSAYVSVTRRFERLLDDSRTGQLAYWTSRGLDNSRMPPATLRA